MNSNVLHSRPFCFRLIKISLVLIGFLVSSSVMAQTTGDYRSKASGNWGDFTTWQVYDGAAWQNAVAGEVPGGTSEADASNVYLEAGFTVTLTNNAACKDLHLNTAADVVRINTQENALEVWGKLRFYTGTAPGTSTSTDSGINGWISTGGVLGTNAGRIRFRGTADRTITNTGETDANATNYGAFLEFAFDSGKTATMNQPLKIGYATVVSGTLKVNPTISLRLAGDGVSTISGSLTVKSGATLIGGQFFMSTANPMLTFTLETDAFLYFDNSASPVLAAQNLILNGTVVLSGTTTSFPTGGARTGTAIVNTFNNLIVNGANSKLMKNNVTINGTLSLGGTAAVGLNGFVLSYGANASLEYNGSTAQTAANAEFPIANGPQNLIINNSNGLTLHAARTITGDLKLSSGLFKLANNDFTLGASSTISGVATSSNMVATNGTGSLRKIFSTAGTFFYPIGEVTGTTEYSYGQVTVNSATAFNGTTYVGLRVIDAAHPAAGSSDLISRYWAVTTNMANINYNGTFQYGSDINDITGTESVIKSYLYSNETPLATGTPQNLVNTVTHRIIMNGLTSAGFATGANLCNISNNSIVTPTTSTFCASSGILLPFDGSVANVTSGTPVYQWQKSVNGAAYTDIALNSQSEDYTEPASLTPGTYAYKRKVNDPLNCLASEANTSSAITIIVTPNISGNTIGSNQTIIAGTAAATLASAATLTGGSGTYTYQWQSSSVSGGPYADVVIGDGSSASYDPTIPTNDIYFVRKVTSGQCATSISNEVAVLQAVCSLTNNSVSTPATTTFCSTSGSLDALDGSAAVVTSSSPVYQWQQSVNGGTYTDITLNGQSEDYTEPSSLTPGTYAYQRKVSDPLSCPVGVSNTSGVITITVTADIAGNTIGNDQIIIAGNAAATLTGNATLSGGSGVYTYEWQSSAVSGGPYMDVAIGDGSSASYDPTIPTNDIYFVRKAISGQCNTSISNEVSVLQAVCSLTNNTVSTPSTTSFCANSGSLDPLDGAAAVVTSGTPVYQWQQSIDGGSYTDISGAQSEDYTESSLTTGTYKYRRILSDPVSCPVNNVSTSNEITLTVLDGIVGNTIGSDQTIVAGDAAVELTSTSLLTGGNGTYTYEWQSSSVQGGPYSSVSIGDGTLDTYDPTSPSTSIYFIRKVTSGICSSSSNEVTIIVSPVTGIENDMNAVGINIFPNPAVELLNIVFSNNASKETLVMKLQNSLGQVVYEASIAQGTAALTIDLANYNQGLYFVNFAKDGKSIVSYKIMKR